MNLAATVTPRLQEVPVRIGAVGLIPTDPARLTPALARQVRSQGFTGVTWMLLDPLAAKEDDLRQVRDILGEAGIRVAQANPHYERLVHPEEARRRAGVKALRRACQCARWLDAATLYVRPGSLNPRGHWWPHPLNTAPQTFDRLLTSLKEAVTAAEDEGVVMALEGHVLSPLDTVEKVKLAIEAVGSPALRFNADPVNMIGSLQDTYNSASFIHRMFDLLGRYVVCAHIKDITVEERFVLHISECLPGDGLLDMETFLQRFEAVCPDGYALIEHLSPASVPQAKQGVDAAARRAGLWWE